MLLSVAVLALLASAQGRAVNISNTWVLPEEGFPVFYRYFRDRISWYEADAVCQFHHANLVTVDTTAQYDAVRAYLKELDISSAVWVGLIRSNPDGDFTWTDYRGLSGDGYWSSAPDSRSAPLCAAADPTADYRWEARACGGPTVASFICELPVPQWALGKEGCMVRALPALTILYLPESAAVQLTADCGMAGVKKVPCTGNVKRDDLLKQLSCADEEELSSTSSPVSTGSWPVSTDFTLIDQDTTNEVTTEENFTTEHEIDINQKHVVTALPHFIYPQTQFKAPTTFENFKKLNGILLSKNLNLGESSDNNIQSNFIPKIEDEENMLTNDQLEKLEDERHMQHKMLHEEIARVGNVENIFTQPTDHFIPPLVMAKAKISDDMTVLSLAQKHAQQLAEKQFSKHKLNKAANEKIMFENYGTFTKSTTEGLDKPLIAPVKTTKFKDIKKEALKTNLPKKYINEKHYDVKNKIFKNTEYKVPITEKPTDAPTTDHSPTKIEVTSVKTPPNVTNQGNIEDDLGMDLTVMLKDAPLAREEYTSFSGDVPKLETIQNKTIVNFTRPDLHNLDITQNTQVNILTTPETKPTENITMTHEVIKITIIADDDDVINNTTVFEITTKMPVFQDSHKNDTTTTNTIAITQTEELHDAHNVTTTHSDRAKTTTYRMESKPTSTPIINTISTIHAYSVTENLSTAHPELTTTERTTTTESTTTTGTQNNINKTETANTENIILSTTLLPKATISANSNINMNTSNTSNETIDVIDGLNSAEYHDILMNMTYHGHNEDGDMNDTDFQSPLLSGAMEPMHRPPRTRRPQQPNRNKFNPFRILG